MRHLDVRDFRLRLDAELADWPTVRVVIDGRDLATVTADLEGWQGFDPKDVLGPRSPWLPADEACRTAVYRCSCGEIGCGALSPTLSEADGLVSWSAFRWVPGEATVRDLADSDLAYSRAWDLPDLTFDARLYRDEIARLTDSGWETDRRKTARLLWQRLLRRPESALLDIVNAKAFMAHDNEDQLRLRLAVKNQGLVWLRVDAPPGTPEESADAMIDALLTTPSGQWPYDMGPVRFKGVWVSD